MLLIERGIAAPAAMYAPGTSPFHVRGSAYGAALKHAAESLPGGLDRVRGACSDPALRAFLDQPFERSGWYDVLPMAPLSELIAQLMGMDLERYLAERTREQARRDLAGLTLLLMRAVSARSVALFLPKLTSRYHDWGGIDARLRGPRRVETVRTGVPQPLLTWYAPVACAFAETALEIAGAPAPRVIVSSSEPDGVTEGVTTYEFVFEITWASEPS
jgi:hypothetical protein